MLLYIEYSIETAERLCKAGYTKLPWYHDPNREYVLIVDTCARNFTGDRTDVIEVDSYQVAVENIEALHLMPTEEVARAYLIGLNIPTSPYVRVLPRRSRNTIHEGFSI